jgi:predicted cobalt transporter CbtA
MNTVKILFIALAVILGTVIAFAAIGMIITAMQYLFWLGVLCVAGFVAIKLFKKSGTPPQLEGRSSDKELENSGRALEEYNRMFHAK